MDRDFHCPPTPDDSSECRLAGNTSFTPCDRYRPIKVRGYDAKRHALVMVDSGAGCVICGHEKYCHRRLTSKTSP